MFTAREVFPGIIHITDNMGVSFTLISGSDSALLIDCGYGLEDVAAFVRTLTDRPVELILTHGHHDHVLGARWFARSRIAAEDLEEFRLRTGRAQREAVAGQARQNGLPVPEDFLTAVIPDPEPLRWHNELASFQCTGYDLGDLEGWLIRVPGHTPGSCVFFVPEYQLLLTGDDWNPCTWMWFPSSLPAPEWRDNMLALLRALEEATEEAVETVLCSHQPLPRTGEELRSFLETVTDDCLKAAPPVDMGNKQYAAIRTHQLSVPDRGWTLIFDLDKV